MTNSLSFSCRGLREPKNRGTCRWRPIIGIAFERSLVGRGTERGNNNHGSHTRGYFSLSDKCHLFSFVFHLLSFSFLSCIISVCQNCSLLAPKEGLTLIIFSSAVGIWFPTLCVLFLKYHSFIYVGIEVLFSEICRLIFTLWINATGFVSSLATFRRL